MTELNKSLDRINQRIKDNADRATMERIKRQATKRHVWQNMDEVSKEMLTEIDKKFVDNADPESNHKAVKVELKSGEKFKQGIFS